MLIRSYSGGMKKVVDVTLVGRIVKNLKINGQEYVGSPPISHQHNSQAMQITS